MTSPQWNGIPIPTGASIEALEALLAAPPPDCWVAFRALALRDDSEGLTLLISETASSDPHRRRAAAEAIGDRQPTEAGAAAVRRLLADENGVVVRAAIAASANLRDTSSHDALVGPLKDGDQHIRAAALRALDRLWKPDDVARLFEVARNDEASAVRREASQVLARRGDERHWRQLLALWQASELPRERRWACDLLAGHGGFADLALVGRFESDSDGHVRKAADRARRAIVARAAAT